jgi:hypothetical protein
MILATRASKRSAPKREGSDMPDREIEIQLNLATAEEAQKLAESIRQEGGKAEVRSEKGILPLAVLLVVAIPPGVALLAMVASHIAHTWRDGGVVIDARGTGRPTVRTEKGLPYGTVVILTRDHDKAQRSDLTNDVDLAKYIEAAMKGVTGGLGAGAAKKSADAAVAKS